MPDNPLGNLKYTKAIDFRSIYSNNAVMLTGFFDVNMIFGEVQGVENEALLVEQKVKLVMSPAQAKIFCLLVWQQINAYEDRFGKLEIKEEMLTPELIPFLARFDEDRARHAKNEG